MLPYRDLVEQLVIGKNDATLKELCLCLEEKVGIKVSQSTMCRFLQKHNLNRKKNTAQSVKLVLIEFRNDEVEYWQTIQKIDPKNLIFVDETPNKSSYE